MCVEPVVVTAEVGTASVVAEVPVTIETEPMPPLWRVDVSPSRAMATPNVVVPELDVDGTVATETTLPL